MKCFIDLSDPIPIYQCIDNDEFDIPFNLPRAKRENVFNNLRCERFEIIPHAHMSHLEMKSHLFTDSEVEKLPLSLNEPLLTKVIDIDKLAEESSYSEIKFVILKNPNPKNRYFKGVPAEIIEKVLDMYQNVVVLGLNEPSFDPEQDNGAMLAHKRVFREDNLYIVELLKLEGVKSGFYYCLLNLLRNFGLTDAYPCSPVLYGLPACEMVLSDSCIFCKIIRGAIPSFKVYETNLTYAFLDINPLSEGHILVIPKFHGARLHEITDEHLADILPACRKILLEGFGDNGANVIPAYNILQNNGRLAHQEVEHVHFHIIPKRNEVEGLGIKWPSNSGNMTQLAQYAESIRAKISQ